MWDSSSLLTDPDIVSFMHACSLEDLLVSRNIPSTASNSSRGQHIDFILGTKLFSSAVRKGGIMSFEQSPFSYHRALFVDLDEHTLFQDSTTDPTSPSQRLLCLKNPNQCKC